MWFLENIEQVLIGAGVIREIWQRKGAKKRKAIETAHTVREVAAKLKHADDLKEALSDLSAAADSVLEGNKRRLAMLEAAGL